MEVFPMKKRIIIGIVIALVLGVLLWRFIPRSADSLIPIEKSDVTSFAAISMTGRNLLGEPTFRIYRIDSNDATPQHIGDILDILKTASYQPDFRNLIPWGMDSVSADKNYDSRTVTVQFACGDDYLDITFQSPTQMYIQTKDASGFRIYHPTNKQVITKLVEYLEANGITEE